MVLKDSPIGVKLILVWFILFLLGILFYPYYVTIVTSDYLHTFWRSIVPLIISAAGVLFSILLIKRKKFSKMCLIIVSALALVWGIITHAEYLIDRGVLVNGFFVNANNWYTKDYIYTILGTILVYFPIL